MNEQRAVAMAEAQESILIISGTWSVWDSENGEEGSHEYPGDEFDDAREAAEQYASEDYETDPSENLYERGHRICVRDPDGEVREFMVSVDYAPEFCAQEVA